jgi:hypothetical protein
MLPPSSGSKSASILKPEHGGSMHVWELGKAKVKLSLFLINEAIEHYAMKMYGVEV